LNGTDFQLRDKVVSFAPQFTVSYTTTEQKPQHSNQRGKPMSVNFKPTDDYVLIERENDEQKTSSGLILPSTGEKPPIGIVRAIGDNATQVKVGDKVVFGKYKGEEITLQGNEYLILRELEIAGILSK